MAEGFSTIAFRGTTEENDFLYNSSTHRFDLDSPIHPIWFSKSRGIASDYVEDEGHLYTALIKSKKNFQIGLDNDDRIFTLTSKKDKYGSPVANVSPNVSKVFRLQTWMNLDFWNSLIKYVGDSIDEISVFDLLMFPQFSKGMISEKYDCITIAKQGQRLDREPDMAIGVLKPSIATVTEIDGKPIA